jgi:hypothetical protein
VFAKTFLEGPRGLKKFQEGIPFWVLTFNSFYLKVFGKFSWKRPPYCMHQCNASALKG